MFGEFARSAAAEVVFLRLIFSSAEAPSRNSQVEVMHCSEVVNQSEKHIQTDTFQNQANHTDCSSSSYSRTKTKPNEKKNKELINIRKMSECAVCPILRLSTSHVSPMTQDVPMSFIHNPPIDSEDLNGDMKVEI
ncbi:hypothetical protein J5N97_015200 [Dioscorea zingiberensis]|uniref:Uncharacterized protein n=1 Tax=Dioscorea zingiberensis TaxID=325984 RepID=A0A9D5HKF4_9LILI|nr:hypothetical protein J5N97_015200 [Dioscorea zingiberensis]